MRVIYLGGAREVGASAILLELDGYKLLLDCGIRQGKKKDPLPDFASIKEFGGLDAILISHAHMDHIGSLPLLSKEFPNAKIYMNKMTLELARILLLDSLKIMNHQEGEIPIFKEDDVLKMFERVVLVPYQKEVTLKEKLTLTTYMAGHIAGASCMYLKGREGSLFYTGDYSLTEQHTVSSLSIPKLRPDVVISEATYGDRLHANREKEEERLIACVKEVLDRKGKVLIPVFALGRSQEVLLILKRAFQKKQLPITDVYVDGMVRNINTAFLNNPLYLKQSLGKKILKGKEVFYNDYIHRVDTKEEREKIIASNNPLIVVASSGMLMGGMSEYYASHFVEDKKNAIFLTGYQDEESNGSVLLQLLDEKEEDRVLKLQDHVYKVSCSIDKVGLSAHADKQEMMQLFQLLMPKTILLGHGDTETITAFAKEITKELNVDVYVPSVGEEISLIIKKKRKQLDFKLEYLYGKEGSMEEFYQFIKEHYQTRNFTKEDMAYLYYGRVPTEEEIENLTKQLIDSIYFTQDRKRFFLFRIQDELELLKQEEKEKEITAQDIEEMIKEKMKEFPYRKISYYLDSKKVVLTFDFPRTIDKHFDEIAKEILEETGITVEKSDSINNLACNNKITEIIGMDNIDKISFLPLEDKFRIKVYERKEGWEKQIEDAIGYKVELVLGVKKPKKEVVSVKDGKKLEQNEAFSYLDFYFQGKEDAPYKKGLKNGKIVLSFITPEIGMKYQNELKELEKTIGYEIEINPNNNLVLIFQVIDNILLKYGLEKEKNPSYLPKKNTIVIKLKEKTEYIQELKVDFFKQTGLELMIEE